MAKASPVDGLDGRTPLDEAARRTLTVRLLDVRRYEQPVLNARDADAVHDMRVATRRLRAAIKMFQTRRTLDEASAEVKSLGRALGLVRDLDVQLEWLGAALDGASGDERTGIAQLHTERAARVDEPVRQLEQAVLRWSSDVVPGLERAFAKVRGRGRLGGRHLRGQITRRLRSMERAADAVVASPDPHTAHQLRIVVKKLRYEAELLELGLPAEVKPILEALAPLQALLGDLHDTDERQALLERTLLTAPAVDQPGTLFLLRRVLGDRERLAAELLVDLRRWQAERVGKALRAPLK